MWSWFWQQGDIDIKAYAGQEHEEIYVDTAPMGMEGDGYMQKFCSSEGKKYTPQKRIGGKNFAYFTSQVL